MHTTNGSLSAQSSSTTAASTLRPRTRRLISIDDELYPTSSSESGASAFGSRATSPNPSSRLWRPNVTTNPSSFVRSASAQTSKAGRDASTAISGLWGNSWSAIQGLATNVLGNEAVQGDTATRRRKPQPGTHKRAGSSATPAQWGVSSSSSSQVGAGTQEERESLVRAMKRKDLLTANEHIISDSVGRFKRRNSDDRTSASAPPGENEDRDALVYIHHVRPQDTLAGITIKFNCQPAVLRKANRMWPNDSVQTKTTIVLPVDACGVKGRPVAGPNAQQEEDLLLGDYGDGTEHSTNANSNDLPNGWCSIKDTNTKIPPSSQSNTDAEPPWKHDSWVLLPKDTNPTEIGRMPRRALGFFPPARRKSLAFSESSTPRPSIELSQPSTSTNSQIDSPTQRPSRPRAPSSLMSLSGPHGRQRSNSNFLQGPGGVGTMNKNVRSPGPAQDGLNKLFAAHLPNVAPPPGQEYLTPWAPSLLDADTGTFAQYGGGSGALTPMSGTAIDLQEIGGAIEGWMRKVGSQASKLLAEPSTGNQGKRSGDPPIGAVGGDFGDLIELRDDAFEIGDGEGDSPRGRSGGEELLIPASDQYPSARPNANLVIRDRGQRGNSRGDSSKMD
ncbi:carbohydrate-binding module family 50 protein [Pleomassaria siparia CBS 279.74]|uniref:Carbohydrate-binding module family 50 protein n=1 Tax=Pleomassaria siparia CBS 279.74 TaxID=1314801 RepID=A0A6G1JYR0_9PLEO|nr:carbohydrate-binding module family 50 protein [Pleomassaria siparia CBS 279.74]